MVTNIFLYSLCYGEPNLLQVAITIFCENLAGGMGTSAFIVLLMRLCTPKYAAGQYALLSALSAVGRIYLGAAFLCVCGKSRILLKNIAN